MYLWELTWEASSVRGVGPAAAARLERLGVVTVRDLLLLLPRGYEDRTAVVPLSKAASEQKVAVVATVSSIMDIGWAGRGKARTPKAIVTDDTAEAALVCFGRPFLRSTLEPGKKFFIWGHFQLRAGELSCADFELEPWTESPISFGRILPVYPLSEGLTQAGIRKIVRAALDEALAEIEPGLPENVRRSRGLPPLREALRGVHFPSSMEQAESSRAAFAYEELFFFEMGVLRRARALASPRPRPRVRKPDLRDALLARLAFNLTKDQESVVAEIDADLFSAAPMARLLQGDVGCGKTLVALLSALLVVGSGEQVAFVAPTELLARQHAESAARLVEPLGVRIAFLSGTVAGEPRALLLRALAAGEIDILFGTHALFSEDVAYRGLGLVIIDEQHKFGVLQRQALMRKGESPDLLLMTATPIPRTLALTAFGDLEVSTIRTMPPGRRPVMTHLAREGNEEKVYAWVRRELEKGRQAYFVYPLIGESEALAVKDAETAFRKLATDVYPGFPVALVHSRVDADETEKTMAAFAARKISVLVATSVVEVGVDVPNASCMVVEHAERFGLSTLHQLRGRVGRGGEQSYAFLVYGKKLTEEGIQRLKIMKETTDGFRIAEEDMRLRGPGELLGIRQSGFLSFRAADLMVHSALLLGAREDAAKVLREDPGFLEPGNVAIGRMLAPSAPGGPPAGCARPSDGDRPVRVTGGSYRGRNILCPPGVIRPSMDRMRQSLFSILGDMEGLSFLDLFSGTGILGVEAASRGARPVLLVEKDPRKRATIQKNIAFVESPIELVTAPVERFLKADHRSWDLIFLDPPFDFVDKGEALDEASQPSHLAAEGLAIIHLHTAEKLATDRPGLGLADRRTYGQSLLLFFRHKG